MLVAPQLEWRLDVDLITKGGKPVRISFGRRIDPLPRAKKMFYLKSVGADRVYTWEEGCMLRVSHCLKK